MINSVCTQEYKSNAIQLDPHVIYKKYTSFKLFYVKTRFLFKKSGSQDYSRNISECPEIL